MNKILVLGGTQFIGRNLVEQLITRPEYEITLFNRQQTNSNLFQNHNKIIGDRNSFDIEKISYDKWDYIIDLSCYSPSALSLTLKQIQSLKKYIFISTCSVYNNNHKQKSLREEKEEILKCTDKDYLDTNVKTYGNRKAECERILKDSKLNHIIFRPALVYGPYDHSDRFYYWLYQIKNYNSILLPDNGVRKFSITYVKDLVNAILEAIMFESILGIYNIISTPQCTIKKILNACEVILKKDPKYYNATPKFLTDNNINQWTGIPLWLDGDHFTYSNNKMLNNFNTKPTIFMQSIKTTVNYFEKQSWPTPTFGLPEIEKQKLMTKI